MAMPKQEKAERRSTRDTEVDESVSTTSEAPGASSLDSDVDSILDEIDEVLEVNTWQRDHRHLPTSWRT